MAQTHSPKTLQVSSVPQTLAKSPKIEKEFVAQ
jgi:hypothetical protein